MFNHPRNLLFVLLALVYCSQAVYAEVNKWKDENGVTHYGDAPTLSGTTPLKFDVKVDKANAERIQNQTEAFYEEQANEDARRTAEARRAEEIGRIEDARRLAFVASRTSHAAPAYRVSKKGATLINSH